MNRSIGFALALAACCVCSALSVAYSTHVSRQLYAELGVNLRNLDALDLQWRKLQIELGTFSAHGLVERVASERLDMVFPSVNNSMMMVR